MIPSFTAAMTKSSKNRVRGPWEQRLIDQRHEQGRRASPVRSLVVLRCRYSNQRAMRECVAQLRALWLSLR